MNKKVQKKFIPLLIAGMLCGSAETALSQAVVQTYSYTGATVNFTVPACVSTVTMEAWGAQGGSIAGSTYPGGLGAYMSGVFTVTPGQVFRLLVGGQGGDISSGPSAATGGGGGSFIAQISGTTTPIPFLVAGGGGGRRDISTGVAANSGAVVGTTAQNSASGGTGVGGTAGNGGSSAEPTGLGTGGPGGGFYTNGGPCGSPGGATPGFAFINGGTIAPTCSPFTSGTSTFGGVGGGGGGCWCYRGTPGAGGGYSGGGAGQNDNAGGGGGSFNGGTSQSNLAANRAGSGQIRLSYNYNGAITLGSSSTTLICTGNSLSLFATSSGPGMVGYVWQPGGSTSPTIVVSPTTSTVYSVTGTNTLACASTVTLAITVSPGIPTLAISASTTQVCLGKTVNLTATGALTYTWSNGAVNGAAFIPSVTAQYTVQGQNGCGITTGVQSVTVAPLPVTTVATPTLICAGSPAVLSAASSATSYTWSPIALFGASITVGPTVTTSYTVAATDGTCSGLSVVSVSVNPIPTVGVVASSTQVCQGYAVTLTGSGAVSYTWSPGIQTGQTVTVNPAISTLYNVTGSNVFGCTSSNSQIILTNPSPTIAIAASKTSVCKGAAVNLFASGANTYSWTGSSSGSSVTVNPLLTTTYSVVGTSTTTGCNSTSTISIAVYTVPFSVTASSSVCAGGTLAIGASGATTYTWSNGLNAPNIVVSPSTNTVYLVSATTVTNGLNCPQSGSVAIVVNALPNVIAAATRTTMCRNESNTLTASGASTYFWSNFKNTASFVLVPTSAIAYNFTVTGTDASGCRKDAVITISVSSCTGIEALGSASDKGLAIYPNPSTGEVTLTFDSPLNLILVNELGQTVQTIELSKQNNFSTQVNNLSNGVYILMGEKDNVKFNEKIIVTK
ncbi:MAG: glycine-rich protein [bacterium]|nr:glycine-rich protein [bacterium]